MTTAIFEATTVQRIREELLTEILTLIKATSGTLPYKQTISLSPEERALMMADLIDEYCNKL